MKVFAPAKVNLGLRVLGTRADGFHALDSVVALLGFGDDVELDRAETTTLEMVDDGVGLGALPTDIERNLAVRAVRLLEREVGRPLPTRIRITKRIPLGGGLGGGSTDAAAVLRGMNDLWALGLSRERLCTLGAELGSDVPLFLLDGTVRMTGRGETVERLPMDGAPPLWLVLANDGSHCPTPQVYGAWDAGHPTPGEREGRLAPPQRTENREQKTESAPPGRPAEPSSEGATPVSPESPVSPVSPTGRQCAAPPNEPSHQASKLPNFPGDPEGRQCDAPPKEPNFQASKLPNFPGDPAGRQSDLTKAGELWDNLCFFLRMGRPTDVAGAVVNDLSEPCLGLFPGVAKTAEALRAAGCMGVTLCGSGATVFGLVGSRAEGERALAHPALAGCWRACTQTLPDGVMAAHGPLTPIVMVRIHVGQPCSV